MRMRRARRGTRSKLESKIAAAGLSQERVMPVAPSISTVSADLRPVQETF